MFHVMEPLQILTLNYSGTNFIARHSYKIEAVQVVKIWAKLPIYIVQPCFFPSRISPTRFVWNNKKRLSGLIWNQKELVDSWN